MLRHESVTAMLLKLVKCIKLQDCFERNANNTSCATPKPFLLSQLTMGFALLVDAIPQTRQAVAQHA